MAKKTTNPLVGAWKAVSFEVHRKNGLSQAPFGKNIRGLIIFTENGRVTVNLSQSGRMEVKTGDIMDASHEEMASNFRGYISYFGKYNFDPQTNELLMHVEGSLFPNWIGDTLKRKVKLFENKLELTTVPTLYGSEEIVGKVIWEKITG